MKWISLGGSLAMLLLSFALRRWNAPAWARTALYLVPALCAVCWGWRRRTGAKKALLFATLTTVCALPALLTSTAAEAAARVLLATALSLFAFRGLGGALQRLTEAPTLTEKHGGRIWLLFFAFTTLACCLSWSFRYPAALTYDLQNQLDQMHGLIDYANIHSIGHTLFLKLGLKAFGSLAAVVLMQILLVSAACATFALWLRHEGCAWEPLLLCLCGVVLCSPATDCMGYLYKDVPYSACVLLVTLGLAQATDDRPMKPLHAVCFGGALAWTALLRLNGLAIVLPCAVIFAVRLRRQWKSLLCLALSAALCLGGVAAVSRFVLHPREQSNGFAVAVFASGIAAVVTEEGAIAPAQQEQLDEIFGDELLDWMRTHYDARDKSWMFWEREYEQEPVPEPLQDPNLHVFNNRFVLRLGERQADVIRLYFQLLPHNLGLMLGDVLWSTTTIWSVGGGNFPYENMALLLVLVFALCLLWRRETWRRRWPVLVPIVFNALSIAVSTATNESRYLFSTVLAFPMLLGLAVAEGRKEGQSDLQTPVNPV